MIETLWDEAKRQANLAKHGLDFADAWKLFDGRLELTVDARSDVELRHLTIGEVDSRFITLVWTLRDGQRRLISMRRSRDEEKRHYRQLYG